MAGGDEALEMRVKKVRVLGGRGRRKKKGVTRENEGGNDGWTERRDKSEVDRYTDRQTDTFTDRQIIQTDQDKH